MTVARPSPSLTPPGSSFDPWSRLLPVMSFLGASSIVANVFNSLLMMFVLEMSQTAVRWLWARLGFSLHITAIFPQHDAAYEWLVFYLAERDIWRQATKSLIITAANGKHRADFDAFTDPGFRLDDIANCAPAAEHVQRFRWRGYWAEVEFSYMEGMYGERPPAQLKLSLYTRKTSVLHAFIKEAHEAYKAGGKKSVIVRSMKMTRFHDIGWATTKAKVPRPSESLILDDGAVSRLLKDIERFRASEAWYHAKGVPYHRGYLLHGPPGSGKTSTIYTIAGEFGLPIHMISLSGRSLSDVSLMDLFASIPKYGIVVMEDIDCVFPPTMVNREDVDLVVDRNGIPLPTFADQSSMVTLSGLLNVLDGVGSEDGRIIFATTNHLEKLDPALRRPGRFDLTIRYGLATRTQSAQLFLHIFSEPGDKHPFNDLSTLADDFSAAIPEHTFSMAQLQGYLISHRDDPYLVVKNARAWVEQEILEKQQIEIYRAEKLRASRTRRDGSSISLPFPDSALGHSTEGSDSCAKYDGSSKTCVSESDPSALCSPSCAPSEIVVSTGDCGTCGDQERSDDWTSITPGPASDSRHVDQQPLASQSSTQS